MHAGLGEGQSPRGSWPWVHIFARRSAKCVLEYAWGGQKTACVLNVCPLFIWQPLRMEIKLFLEWNNISQCPLYTYSGVHCIVGHPLFFFFIYMLIRHWLCATSTSTLLNSSQSVQYVSCQRWLLFAVPWILLWWWCVWVVLCGGWWCSLLNNKKNKLALERSA